MHFFSSTHRATKKGKLFAFCWRDLLVQPWSSGTHTHTATHCIPVDRRAGYAEILSNLFRFIFGIGEFFAPVSYLKYIWGQKKKRGEG